MKWISRFICNRVKPDNQEVLDAVKILSNQVNELTKRVARLERYYYRHRKDYPEPESEEENDLTWLKE